MHGQLKEYEIMICYQKFPESIGQPHVSCIDDGKSLFIAMKMYILMGPLQAYPDSASFE